MFAFHVRNELEIATSVMLRQGAGKGGKAARLQFTASMFRWL